MVGVVAEITLSPRISTYHISSGSLTGFLEEVKKEGIIRK